jgi:hypothetical protein
MALLSTAPLLWQFAATRAVLQQRPRAYYERLLLWLITPHDAMHTKGRTPDPCP